MGQIIVQVNDEPTELASGTTLAALLEQLKVKPRGIAAAINSEVIPQSQWHAAALESGDSVLIITATQGG
jgi:sulfur carrier protein